MADFLEGFRTVLFALLAVIKQSLASLGLNVGDQVAAGILVASVVLVVGLLVIAIRGGGSRSSKGPKPGSDEFKLGLLRDLKADADAYQELYDNGLIEADFFADEMMQIAQVARPMADALQTPQ